MEPVLSEVEGRSGMREVYSPILPDSASLHPGYAGWKTVFYNLEQKMLLFFYF